MMSAETVGGIDLWTPGEFRMLSPKACFWMAKLLDSIEDGASWPDATLYARVAYLEKDENNAFDRVAYRILLMMATSYKWASYRLVCMDDWIEGWRLLDMFVGTQSQGASDGSYNSAMFIKLYEVLGVVFTSVAADVFNCFDQIIRELIYEPLRPGGMPTQVLPAHDSNVENVQVHNTIAGGIGKA